MAMDGTPRDPPDTVPIEDRRPAPLTPDQEGLLELGLPMVFQCAREIARRYHGLVTAEELLAPGTIALRQTVVCYREERHPSFPVYARHHILGRMINAVRTESFSQRARVERAMDRAFEVVSAHQVVDVDLFEGEIPDIVAGVHRAGAELLAATYLAAVRAAQPADEEERLVDRISILDAIEQLPPHEREVIRLVDEEGLTIDEAAAQLGVNSKMVKRRHASGLAKLRAFLEERGAKPPRR